MGVLVEFVMLFAALVIELLLGSFGFVPCLTMFVIFHSSRCVSLRFATVAGLAVGVLIDLVYCRDASGTPLWYMIALYSGELVLIRCEKDGASRPLRVVLPGAAIGGVLTLRWLIAARDPGAGYAMMALDLVSGMAGGILKLALTVLIADPLCGYLGARGYLPPLGVPAGSGKPNRRVRRVRAEKVMGKRS